MTHTPQVPQESKQELIRIEQVSFSYNENVVLDAASLSVYKGDYVAIVGDNGSGKTTLLRLVLGLENPTQGNILIYGTPVSEYVHSGKIGYVPQHAIRIQTVFPITPTDVVRTALSVPDFSAKKYAHDEMIARALSLVGIAGKKDSLIGNLSGGELQRVFIARALVTNPEILILDEPTVGVSRSAREDFYALLKNLNTQHGITVLLVTHDTIHDGEKNMHVAYLEGGTICYHPNNAAKGEHHHRHVHTQ